MRKFDYYVDHEKKMTEIFTRQECRLTPEQYVEIRARFVYLIGDIQEDEDIKEIREEVNNLGVILEFLYETKCLFLEQYYSLREIVNRIHDDAEKLYAGEEVPEW